jgi:chromosome segregation ATPase
MARVGIDYQDVANIAQKLQGLGKNTTVDAVRELLGTGSRTTIARHLKQWQGKNQLLGGNIGVPQELLALIRGLWEALQAQTESQVTEIKDNTKQEIAVIKEKWTAAEQRSLALQTQVHTLEEQLHQARAQNVAQAATLVEEQQVGSKLADRNQALHDAIEAEKTENARLHQLLHQVQHNLEHYQDAMQKRHQETTLLFEKHKNQYEQEQAVLRQQLSEALIAKEKWQAQYEDRNRQVQNLETRYEIAYKQTVEQEVNTRHKESQCQELSHQNAEYAQQLARMTAQLQEREQQLALTSHQRIELQQALQRSEDKVDTLRNEHLFWVSEKATLVEQLKQWEVAAMKQPAVEKLS